MTFAELLATLDAIIPGSYRCAPERWRYVGPGDDTRQSFRWTASSGDFHLVAKTPEELVALARGHFAQVDVAEAVAAVDTTGVAA